MLLDAWEGRHRSLAKAVSWRVALTGGMCFLLSVLMMRCQATLLWGSPATKGLAPHRWCQALCRLGPFEGERGCQPPVAGASTGG